LFDELGVRRAVELLGGSHIRQTCFYSASGSIASVPTNWLGGGPALGLSRAALDNALLERAREAGVRVLCETRLVGAKANRRKINAAILRAADGTRSEAQADLFIDATGRQAAFSAALGKRQGSRVGDAQPKYLAFKNHFVNALPEPETCEMYFFPGGYGGVNRIEGDLFNFCFIVRNRPGIARRAANLLQHEIIAQNLRAKETMAAAVAVRDWIGVPVSLYGFGRRITADNLMYVGDAGAFIDPFTGSGILMALESARRAADCLAAADLIIPKALRLYGARSRLEFGPRLLAASILRRAAFSQIWSSAAISLAGRFGHLRRFLAHSTRGVPKAGLP
jgi:flavin-dependent dehydrogenase